MRSTGLSGSVGLSWPTGRVKPSRRGSFGRQPTDRIGSQLPPSVDAPTWCLELSRAVHHLQKHSSPDPADLDAGLRRFLGSDGPIWAAQDIAVGGTSIAVLTVDPTTAAERPFLAHGTFGNAQKMIVRDGAIYIRRLGSSQEADATEVSEMLTARTQSVVDAGPPWQLRIEANGGLAAIAYDQQAVESWLEAERGPL